MKIIPFALLASLLAFGTAVADPQRDAPRPDFPAVGSTYFMVYANARRAENGHVEIADYLMLKVIKTLPSGWLYATEIKEAHTVDPADSRKVIVTRTEGSSAWYNLQAFSKAVEVMKKEGS